MSLAPTALDSNVTTDPGGSREPSETPPLVARRLWMGNSDLIAAVWLVGSLFCLIMASLMSVGEDRRVYIVGLHQPVPEMCWLYRTLRIDCPGCGLTRTFIHLAHADLSAALAISPVGVLVFLFACAQVPFATAQLIFRQRGRWIESWGFWNDWSVAGLLIALLVQWAIKIAFF